MIGKSQAQADQVSAETEPLLKDRYRRCYDKIASDDLVQPLESGKEARNLPLLRWIGDARGKRVLDVGSAQGLLLDSLGRAKARVCADLAWPYLRVARAKEHAAVQADGEHLPFEPAAFDVVVCTGVLEHVLDPSAVVQEVKRVLAPGGRFYVLVPWEEDITKYGKDSGAYEFAHLRSFTDDAVRSLFQGFEEVRRRGVEPNVACPPHEKLLNLLPGPAIAWLRWIYRRAWVLFDYLEGRWKWRLPRRIQYAYWRWYWKQLAEFPKRDWLWLWMYPPFHMVFELRPLSAEQAER